MSRLEEIKELIAEANELSDKIADSNSYPMAWEDKISDNLAYLFSECHIDWLIEQAEKVEQLENRKEEILVESGKRWTKLIKIQQILEEN